MQLSESTLARLLIYVRTDPDHPAKLRVRELEQQIVEVVRGWDDQLRDALIEGHGEERGLELANDYASISRPPIARTWRRAARSTTSSASTRSANDPIALQMRLYRPATATAVAAAFQALPPRPPRSRCRDALPLLENMGLRVITESPYRIELPGGELIWIQDFDLQCAPLELPDPAEVREIFQEAFARAWRARCGERRLQPARARGAPRLAPGRACCAPTAATCCRRALPFSQAYMEEVLNRNPQIARALIEEFTARFDPALAPAAARARRGLRRSDGAGARRRRERATRTASCAPSSHVLQATLRTNYFQRDADERAQALRLLQARSARRSPSCRSRGRCSRSSCTRRASKACTCAAPRWRAAALRWSDRREDFRTEVLGLMKAQKVKNTVIVPSGAKGGFVPKRLPAGDRDEIQREGIACYQTFIRGLLDITDNIVDGKVVPPPRVVRVDDDDPYLVVAADKGTATFSDIANGIAREYDFWLGDAFASGGSAGYDHKKMAITARGGWEASSATSASWASTCRRRTSPRSASATWRATSSATACCSRAASACWPRSTTSTSSSTRVRTRSAASASASGCSTCPRSTWADYDAKLLSKGGGVWSRRDKSIPLRREARALLGLRRTPCRPPSSSARS